MKGDFNGPLPKHRGRIVDSFDTPVSPIAGIQGWSGTSKEDSLGAVEPRPPPRRPPPPVGPGRPVPCRPASPGGFVPFLRGPLAFSTRNTGEKRGLGVGAAQKRRARRHRAPRRGAGHQAAPPGNGGGHRGAGHSRSGGYETFVQVYCRTAQRR